MVDSQYQPIVTASPQTPVRNGQDLHQLIDSLNEKFALDLPNPHHYSPAVERQKNEQPQLSLRWKGYSGVRRLYFSREADLNRVLNNFEEWVVGSLSYAPLTGGVMRNGGCQRGVGAGAGGGHRGMISQEKDVRLGYLMELINDEIYFLNQGMFTTRNTATLNGPINLGPAQPLSRPVKRFSEEKEDEFHTAPNSPIKRTTDVDEFPDSTLDNEANWAPLDPQTGGSGNGNGPMHIARSPKGEGPSRFVERLTAPEPPLRRYDAVGDNRFSTITTSLLTGSGDSGLDVSFNSEATESFTLLDAETQYEDSVVRHMLSQEMKTSFSTDILGGTSGAQYSTEEEIVSKLLHNGPFSINRSFPPCIPLPYRYELERIGRAWGVPFDRMLMGNKIPFKTYDGFWKWIEGHNQRNGKLLPERPTRRVWDAAMAAMTGDSRTDKHSEAVVFSGDLNWCESEQQQGILKLKLNPLKTEKTCRFRRRFGSDRFLSLTMPAPTRPPGHLRLTSQPTLLRESLASWLTQHVHCCMGRSWRPFFIAEAKSKRKVKGEPRFKVEFFAVDGEDFDHSHWTPPSIAPVRQDSTKPTPMSLEALMDWHMAPEANMAQSNCKLFQRISIGLSKTFATVVLRPPQILPLHDKPGQPVMNDGCALMSRGLAKEICDSLGISGTTPSCFQGRIAGAKGLWMVDRHRSHLSTDDDDDDDDDIWIQISDSQLKIQPHPATWQEPVDDEQLTFEVVKWSKPLHPVDLNVQLLGILEHGSGRGVKEYIAELTRAGIDALYRDFAEVLQSNSSILCRSLIQKLRPADDSSGLLAHKIRRLEMWTASDAEAIIRYTEAGFAPQSFWPLRKRLGKCIKGLLDRYVDELHIEVPLSTYAFCIADPYGVLKPGEVHFGFSNNWHGAGSGFEDNLLDGMDVLVGRLPAHLPSDIQRRRAVWKPELRHFKDVIVFSTQGDMPLAHMLSGGDYDGDTPWVCWDQKIIQGFHHSDLPQEELSHPPEHFGLTNHSIPMREIQSREEFWQRVFTFNLTLSNLGRCTVEHEKISYEESIDSRKAKELACLLGHLVDGRKGGVHLSEQAWQQYRKQISPRAREFPAYRNPGRRPKSSNIIDYLKFQVASRQRVAVLRQLETQFPEKASSGQRDEDLVQPWNKTWKVAQHDKEENGGDLHAVLTHTVTKFNALKLQWDCSFHGENNTRREFTAMAREAAEQAKAIPPPCLPSNQSHGSNPHPLLRTWHHDPDAWARVLASYAYKQFPEASFVIHAFGETLCQIKASTMPARTVTNEILACYRLNQKVALQLTAHGVVPGDDEDGDSDDSEEEFEGGDVIDAILHNSSQRIPRGSDLDDTMSVE